MSTIRNSCLRYVPFLLLCTLSGCNNSSVSGAGSSVAFSGDSSGLSANIQPPTSAVRKGSFTVWANPENPQPNQEYVIYTSIRLPRGTENYDAGDISGQLIGTDGFAIPVGGARNPFSKFVFSAEKAKAVVTTRVPGAATSGIRDDISINSKLLSEKQSLTLVFGFEKE